MSSIIEGYEYDIFISYRQKDNKHDGWVTEFVDNLKGELEATFKEDISIYFDENPHDGLLETHSVDKSLEGKLKCLIFIPVISQTYCDPKSYAWQHEFCAFNKLAREDRFGRDIRLISGNVASRILPIKIHDLDKEDKTLLEDELGDILRSIEFIYKEAGVNRPLKPMDDAKENLNKTQYINQVNKVANAVKEIITALKKESQHSEEVIKEYSDSNPSRQMNLRKKIIAGTLILLALIVLGYILIPKLNKSEKEVEKSIAVLPFTNLSNDPEQEYFSEGVVETILTHLYKVGELKVISSTSTKKYKNTELSIKKIARELGVSSILEGSVQKIGNNVRITAQLIDAKTDAHIWSEIYDRDISDIFSIESDVAQKVAKELKAAMTAKEKVQIETSSTNNPEAYNLYLQGRFFWNKRTKEGVDKSVEYFEKAVVSDTAYALAYAGLADAYYILAWYGWCPREEGYAEARKFALKALKIDKNLAEAHATLGGLFCWYEWNWEAARKELLLATKLNPNFASAHQYYSELLDILRQNKEARDQINLALKLDPYSWVFNIISAINYYHEGKYKESLDESLKLKEINPDRMDSYWYCFELYVKTGEGLKALEELQKIIQNDTLNAKFVNVVKEVYNQSGTKGLLNWLIELELKKTTPSIWNLAKWYSMADNREEALTWSEKALQEKVSNTPRMNNDPAFDNIRSDPRFLAIIEKMGLSKY